MLKVDAVHAYYGQSHILQGVSLAVNAGEVVSLLGRNGAGKTTLIQTIIGFIPPRRGAIWWQQTDITRWPAHRIARLGVGLVPQGRGVFPALSVRENITLAARPGPWTLERMLALFPALAARLQHLGHQLSGGEQQMLALARALLTNPRLLLLDEPSEGLAPLIVAEIEAVINQLSQAGLSILLVEQNLRLALNLSSRVYVMNKGQIVFNGSPTTLNARPDVRQKYLGV